MHRLKRGSKLLVIAAFIMSMTMTGCSLQNSTEETTTSTTAENTATVNTTSYDVSNPENMSDLVLDMSAWNYDSDHDVYWQIGVSYCAKPDATDYESMGIYVPGAYMDAQKNEDGTYTCTINTQNEVNGYTSETAPIVMPINTAGYSAQAAPTSYSYDGISEYLESGFIYVYAGCRGRNNGENEDGTSYSGGAPWGVTDLKAAIRYLRYNGNNLPGDTDRIFTFGHSGGGAQSALMGATGDNELYFEYLESIGAAMLDEDGNYISDAVSGAMSWCPITSLDQADEAYEWMMGQYSDSGTRADTTWTSALSDDLANEFATYINQLGLTDEDGNVLTLTSSEDGIYTSGTYYDYVLKTIETSLNNFLSDTEFPYTSGGSVEMADGGFAGGGETPKGEKPEDGELPDRELPTDGELPSGEKPSKGMGKSGRDTESVTYETAQDYIDSLNSDVEWISYDSETNTATITSVGDFVTHCKNASKDVGAFDSLDTSQAENMLFGNAENDALHFDVIMSNLLIANSSKYEQYSDYDSSYAKAYEEDMDNVDELNVATSVRQNMYNPMYYLSNYYDGYGTSTVAKYWRINSGIAQGDTSLTTEMNLALALQAYDGVESVDFTTVWGQGHTTAERTGSSSENFIQWVNECLE